MAKLQNDYDRMRSSFLRIIRLVACVTVPMSLILALEADDVVKMLLGNKWSETVPIVQITCMVAVVRSVEVLFPPVLFACYRGKFLFFWTMALIAIMPLFFWAGAEWDGAFGVAAVWVAIYPIFVTVLAREGIKELRMEWSTVIRQIIPVITAALMMGLAVIALRAMIPGTDTAAIVSRLVLSGLISLVVYGIGIMVQSRSLFAEVREICEWVVRPRFAFGK
jgi:O-antigen/teichoic acid export membrane protein